MSTPTIHDHAGALACIHPDTPFFEQLERIAQALADAHEVGRVSGIKEAADVAQKKADAWAKFAEHSEASHWKSVAADLIKLDILALLPEVKP